MGRNSCKPWSRKNTQSSLSALVMNKKQMEAINQFKDFIHFIEMLELHWVKILDKSVPLSDLPNDGTFRIRKVENERLL